MKLKVIEQEIIVTNKTTTCKLTVIPCICVKNHWRRYPAIGVIGITTCKNNDKFDYNKGAKIALAKAEKKAYEIIDKKVKREIEIISAKLNQLTSFTEFANKVIKHDEEYIKQLSK